MCLYVYKHAKLCNCCNVCEWQFAYLYFCSFVLFRVPFSLLFLFLVESPRQGVFMDMCAYTSAWIINFLFIRIYLFYFCLLASRILGLFFSHMFAYATVFKCAFLFYAFLSARFLASGQSHRGEYVMQYYMFFCMTAQYITVLKRWINSSILLEMYWINETVLINTFQCIFPLLIN